LNLLRHEGRLRAQYVDDAAAISKITGAYGLIVSGTPMSAASALQGDGHVTSFSISDTAASIQNNLDALNGDSKLTRVTVSDSIPLTGKLLLHVAFGFPSGALATVVMGTHQSRGTPMEWWQVMGDHQRVEMRNVHEVRHFRAPPFKVSDPAATLDPATDTLIWEPNLTAAANEDHKGYHALLGEFLKAVRGEPNDAPRIAAGAQAMRVLEAMVRSMANGAWETV